MAGVEERLTIVEEMMDCVLAIHEEYLSKKERWNGLSDNEKTQYEKIKDHFKEEEEKAKNVTAASK